MKLFVGVASIGCSLVIACGSGSGGGSPGNTGGGGGGTTGSSGGGITSGTGGTGGGATTGTGGGSPLDAAGGGSSGAAGPPAPGSGGGGVAEAGSPPKRSESDAAAPAAGCRPGALVCEDFERYADGATDLSPAWMVYGYSGTVKVDSTKAHAGNRALHVTTQAGGHHYSDIIKQTQDGTAVLPLVHYGRVMVWVSEVPAASHWSINHAGGPPAGMKNVLAKYSDGGEKGELVSGYSVRQRALAADGSFLLRGGGPETTDPNPTADCTKVAQNETMPTKTWVCWEWKFDATKNENHLWVNGVAQTEVDVVGQSTPCSTGGNVVWQGPTAFTKLIVGWEHYQNDAPAQEAWLDDLVIDTQPIGCP
jgi:Cip1-like, core domain